MHQLICGLALAGFMVGSAQANLTYVKEDGTQTKLFIPEDSTASVYEGENKVLGGRTMLDEGNPGEPGRNGVRIVPDEDNGCPPVALTFYRDYATLSIMTGEPAKHSGTCSMQTINGRYRLQRLDEIQVE